jgi:mono/diheme cytochrome c family protein
MRPTTLRQTQENWRTRMRAISTHARLLLMAIAGSGTRAAAADADHGADLARRWCASCHVVSPEQAQASVDMRIVCRKHALRPSG